MRNFLSKVFFWTYPRGSWQYDLMCIAILAFIFLTPPSVLDGSAFKRSGDVQAPLTTEEPEQIAGTESSR